MTILLPALLATVAALVLAVVALFVLVLRQRRSLRLAWRAVSKHQFALDRQARLLYQLKPGWEDDRAKTRVMNSGQTYLPVDFQHSWW